MKKRRTPPPAEAGSNEAAGDHGSTISVSPAGAQFQTRCAVIYVASPLSTFSEPWYDLRIAAVASHYPRVKVLPARGLFRDSGEWLRAFPVILRTVDRLVFFVDRFGMVGRGVYDEVGAALASRLPVELLEPDGTFRPYGEVELSVCRRR